MNKQQLIEKIFQTLQRQTFANWYTHGNFDKWFSGYDRNDKPVSEEQVKADIAKLFGLTD